MDFSLYELALSVKRPPQTMPISPVTLLSVVGSVIDLLVEQQISATLWIKLPPGKIWQAEIQRYHKEESVSNTIYTCNVYTNNSEGVTNGVVNQADGSRFQTRPDSPVVPVQLAPISQLKREYFLLVLSPQFCALILAHRPRIKRQNGTRKANQERTQPLLAICSFEERVIQRVLNGIKQAILLRKRYANARSLSYTTPTDLLANWDSRFSSSPAPDPVLLSQLLAKQIQQHDETQRSAITGSTAAALQLQNQALLSTLNLKDEFLSNLCQELRTPLTNMKTALSLLNSPQLKPGQRQRYLQMLNTECDRQNSLITGLQELLQLDRLAEQSVLQPVRLSDIVPGVVSTYQPLAQEKGIMLAYTVPTNLPAISCVSNWLKQIVINLLHNSIKFTPSGGQVWVLSRLQGDYVQLEFRDTGIGIATSEIPKIFDRFYRVRTIAGEDLGGAGLGLTIVQQLLLRCGGSISVKSKLGEGSTFNVLLPVTSSPEKNSRVSPTALS